MCQGTLFPFHPCSDDLGKHRKYEEALGLKDEWKGVCQTKLACRADTQVTEQADGWKWCGLEMEEGWLNLRMGRDLVTDALCYEAFNKLWIGSSLFPLLTVTVGQLIDSWHCVHGCTCMYVEKMMTTTNWNVWDIKMHHLVMIYLIYVICGPISWFSNGLSYDSCALKADMMAASAWWV